MGQPTVKTSFAGGEFAPKLIARVDLAKYHTGAALMRNFFVDYSGGGASTRPGTKFINQVKTAGARLIEFQPSTTLSFVLEFGQNYIRFYSNGSAILEAVVAIQSITGSPVTVTSTANGYANGDWVFISGAYYIVTNAATNSYQLTDLFGNNVLALTGTQAQRVYTITTPYAASDLYPNPLTGNPGLKFVQDVTSLIICHPSYQPAILTEFAANNWTYSIISFGPTIATPVGPSTATPAITTNLTTGTNANYGYAVTAVDANGQESAPSLPAQISLAQTIQVGAGTIKITWAVVPGAVSYNVYKTEPTIGSGAAFAIQSGAQYGFIGNVTGTNFTEATPGVAPDFSQTPPIPQNPFLGASVQSLTLNNKGFKLTTVPTITIDPPTSGLQATAITSCEVNTAAISSAGAGFSTGNYSIGNGIVIDVTSVGAGTGNITGISIVNRGSITAGNLPATLQITTPTPPADGGANGLIALSWRAGTLILVDGGFGYTTVPNVAFAGSFGSGGSLPTATAVLGAASLGNPGVPGFFQERLVLAAQAQGLQSYEMSQPNSFFNFNTSNPVQDDDAISGTIIGEELNDIRSLIPVPTGVIALTGKGAWLLNGGGGFSSNSPITPANQTASSQAFNGANDLKPVKNNLDVLYGTNKGNYVRDLAYNIYANIYTGTDISVFSNHLFFGYYLLDWAWAEEPFKTLWSIRNDGTMLSLGYVKEQEVIGWAQHDTDGQFLSACSVIENVGGNIVDAVYLIVQRLINGQLVQYVERLADRYFPYGYEDSWSVDCALQTQPQSSPTGTLTFTGNASAVGNAVTLTDTADAPFTAAMATNNWVVRAGGGIYKITAFTSTSVVTASVVRIPVFINPYTSVPFPISTGYTIWQPVTTVSGLTQLVGKTVTGVADGAVVSPQVVSASGTITLATAASKITLGLAFTPQLQTLPLDLGQPTVQGKRKKLPSVTLRVADTLGLQVGTTFANAVSMKDFVIGAIPTLSFGVTAIADLVNPSYNPTGVVIDGWQLMDQVWQEAGQLCIQQNLPYPATVIGVFPEVVVGDTK